MRARSGSLKVSLSESSVGFDREDLVTSGRISNQARGFGRSGKSVQGRGSMSARKSRQVDSNKVTISALKALGIGVAERACEAAVVGGLRRDSDRPSGMGSASWVSHSGSGISQRENRQDFDRVKKK